MTGVRRHLIFVLTIACFQNGALLAQSPVIAHNPLAGAEVGTNGLVSACAVFDDGQGPALYIGGEFTSINGIPANHVAKWDGHSWSAVGSGFDGRVHAMAVFDNGHGPALYVGGHNPNPVNRLAKWDGTQWTPLASEIGGHAVFALAVFDDGSGPALYIGGNVSSAGGLPISDIVKWDGKHWSALGCGTNWHVYALTVFDDGNGPGLYAGGDFTTAGDARAENIAQWDGKSWSALGFGTNSQVYAMSVFDDGGGPALYVGGSFAVAGDVISNRIAKWNGKTWSEIGGLQGVNGTVFALAVMDDGRGPALYIGGDFLTFLDGPRATRVAKWDGKNWSALASGVSGRVHALAGFDDGTGSALFAGGLFSTAGEVQTSNIARWDGNSWSAVGSAPGRKF